MHGEDFPESMRNAPPKALWGNGFKIMKNTAQESGIGPLMNIYVDIFGEPNDILIGEAGKHMKKRHEKRA